LKSGKIPNTHSIGSIGYPNFGVFAVGEIATENTGAVAPTHLVTETPKPAWSSLQRGRRLRQHVGVTPVHRHQAARHPMGLAKPD